MQILGVVLVLISVTTVVGPIAGVIIAYKDNLVGLVLPSNVQEIISNTLAISPNSQTSDQNTLTNGNTGEPQFQMPQYVESQYDLDTRTVTLTVSFSNPLNYDLTVKSISADVECATHHFALGHASLQSPVNVPAGQTANITVTCTWTQEAENHFRTDHAEATSIDVNIINISVNVNDITVQIPDSYLIPNIPLT